MADGDVRLRLSVEGIETLNAYEKAIRETRSALKDAAIGSKEFYELSKKLADLQNDRSEALQASASNTKKLHDAYFALGTQVRVNALPAITSFSQVIQDAPYGIRGVANNIDQLTQQFIYLRKETGGTANAFKAMFSQLNGPTGILVAVSAFTSLATVLGDKLFPAAKDTRNEVEQLRNALADLGDISRPERLGQLVVRMNELQQEANKLSTKSSFWALIGSLAGSRGQGAFTAGMFAPSEAAKLAAEQAAAGGRSAVEGASDLASKEYAQQAAWANRFRDVAGWNPEYVRGLTRSRPGGAGPMQIGGQVLVNGDATKAELAKIKPSFVDIFQSMGGFQTAATAGFMQMGAVFQRAVGGAVRKVFGEANTLLNQLVSSFTEAFLNMLVNLGVRAIGAELGLPVLSVSGVAGGGERTTIGEIVAMRKAIESIDVQVDGVRVYTKTQQGKRQKATRTW